MDRICSNINAEADRARHVPRNLRLDLCVRVQPITLQHTARKEVTNLGSNGFKAHANLAYSVGGDRDACLGVHILFGEVDVSPGCGADDVDVDVDALARAGAGTDVAPCQEPGTGLQKYSAFFDEKGVMVQEVFETWVGELVEGTMGGGAT